MEVAYDQSPRPSNRPHWKRLGLVSAYMSGILMNQNADKAAIIGMACILPGAPNLSAFHNNLQQGIDAITEVPPGRWDPVFFDPDPQKTDRIYCRRGGFIGADSEFDPLPFGIMPVAARGADPDQMLTLKTVQDALEDADLSSSALDQRRDRTAVILGRGGYPGVGAAAAVQHARTTEQILASVAAVAPDLSQEQLQELKQDLLKQSGHYGGDTAIGLVPNIVASRVANRFDLKGSAYTIDAACASSLIAVEHSVRELAIGTADLVITGGIHLCDDLIFWNVFSRLGAISPSQQIRPFDRGADGLLVGEGIGILVLKRLADALQDNDRIYAVIAGVGTSSDGRARSLMQPNVEGQLLALERAWSRTQQAPSSIGLLEAHGTGTPNGDLVELTTIARFFGADLPARPCLGSVKSMIGHAMPAAGAASLIKAALAIHNRFLPPTLHCEEPHPLMAETGFRLLTKAEPWESGGQHPVAAVNAFGFGGINAHAILEAVEPPSTTGRSGYRAQSPATPFRLMSANEPQALLTALDDKNKAPAPGRLRLAIENPTPERVALARKIVARGTAWRGRNGIWFSPDAMLENGGKVAFVYPGVDGQFEPRINDLCAWFNQPPPPFLEAHRNLVDASTGIIGFGRWLTDLLERIGIRPSLLAGHSIGEWTGMIVSGISRPDESDQFVEEMAPSLQVALPGVAFAAAGCGIERANQALQGLEQIALSHDNCPHQVILCGIDRSIDQACERLRQAGILVEKLTFRSGFHSPLFEPYVQSLWENFSHFTIGPAQLPLWSSTTVAPYPVDEQSVKQLFIDHLTHPVRFRELTDKLHEDGVRFFIQVGSGRLIGFIEDTLKGREFAAMAAHENGLPALQQLRRLASGIWCEGGNVDLSVLGLAVENPRRLPRDGSTSTIRLPLAAPFVRVKPVARPRPAGAKPQQPESSPIEPALLTGDDPVLAAVANLHADLSTFAQEIVAEYQADAKRPLSRPGPSGSIIERVRRYSLDAMPELYDHCFVPVPEGWPSRRDRFPVVPMAASLQTLLDLAAELVPEKTPIALERIRAIRWLEVEPPVDIPIRAVYDGIDRVQVEIGSNLTGTVVLADDYPEPTAPRPVDRGEIEAPPITGRAFYLERWGFHGPLYRGVLGVEAAGRGGLVGRICQTEAPGSLLDAAGQLSGYWVIAFCENNRLALPFRIDRITFYGPTPKVGDLCHCSLHVTELTDDWIRADQEIYQGDKLVAKFEGREDRRFEINRPMRKVLTFPGENTYRVKRPQGYMLVDETWRASASRYFVARGYLSEREMKHYESLQVRNQRPWLLGRVAAKDALRQTLWDRSAEDLFPVQISITNTDRGCPVARGPWKDDLRISIAHKETVAVAIVADGEDVGIDIEQIEPRTDAFAARILTDAELRRLPNTDRDLWLTRVWVAKEAVAKAELTGLQGDPKRFKLTEIDGARLCVNERWVQTAQEGEYLVGWTEAAALC